MLTWALAVILAFLLGLSAEYAKHNLRVGMVAILLGGMVLGTCHRLAFPVDGLFSVSMLFMLFCYFVGLVVEIRLWAKPREKKE